jgi:hypothetical protein
MPCWASSGNPTPRCNSIFGDCKTLLHQIEVRIDQRLHEVGMRLDTEAEVSWSICACGLSKVGVIYRIQSTDDSGR